MGINTITGRITVETGAAYPVAGLEVVAISKAPDGQMIELGRAITNWDGQFEIVATDSPGSKLALTVRDARHMEIKVVTRKIRRDGVRMKITIPPEAAQEHGRSVTLPASPDAPFVPLPHMLDTITRAVDLIAPQGTPHHDRYLEAARCPIPPWQLGAEMYRDALDVLRGNPFAANRFVELVELINADLRAEIHSLTDNGGRTDHVHDDGVPRDAPFLPPEKTIPIFAAAAMIAKPGLYSLDRIANGVLRLLCDFEDFGFVHRLADDATVSRQAQPRFAAVLDWRLPECGPIPKPGDPGIPWPEKRKCLPWLDWHRECFNATLEGARTVAYTITQVTPHGACSGDVISIKGTNFGSSGIVVFGRHGGGELEVVAQTWTDTLITVTVPPTAAGPLWLRIPAGTRVVCGVVIETSVAGKVYGAVLGSLYIEALHLGGSPMPPFVVRPGAPISVHWRVYGANTIKVKVYDETGASVVTLTFAPGNGYLATLNAPTVSSPRLWQALVTASGQCAPPPGLVTRSIDIWISEDPALAIDGIEVTQAIQYYKSSLHLTDPADQQADNSMTLVRNKAAWVRVYLKSWSPPNFNGVNWTGVQGTLRVERIENGQVTWSTTLNPQNPMLTVTVGAAYADVRRNIGRTLNFVIPAAEARGRLRLTAECTLTSIPFGSPIAPGSVTVDFALEQRLRIAGIMVAYDGPPMIDSPPGTPHLVLAAPTMADLDATLPLTLATYPVGADFETRDAGTLTLVVPLTDPPSLTGCTNNWKRLLDEVALARIADGNRAGWIYYGLLPIDVPSSALGCGGSVASSFNGLQVALAHELGHVFGRMHAPCGLVSNIDDTYPAYEPYDTAMNPQARIGEYGLDIRTGTIHPPTENDFMSYCSPRWVSLHNHAAFMNLPNLNLNPRIIPVGYNAAASSLPDETGLPQRFEMINVVGGVDEDGNYHVRSVARAKVELGASGATQTKVQIELLDAEGRKLAFGWIFAYVPQAHGGGPCHCGRGSTRGEPLSPPYLFEARLSHRDDGVVLRIREGEKVLWERRAFHIRPRLKIELCRITKQRQLQLRWSSKYDAGSTPEFWVQWAPGRTEDWRCLAVGLRDNETTLTANALPPGKHRIRVSLHDGFTSAFATQVVNVPDHGPTVSILHPMEGEVLDGSQGLLLWGRAVDSHGRLVGDEKLEWRLNKRKVGTGGELRLSSDDLGDGEMEAELIATSASGRSARKVRFSVVGTRHSTVDN